MPERRPRISVVNDNAEFLDLMSAILDEDAGYDVSLFNGEVVAMDELAASDPHLIIVDLLLGGASGLGDRHARAFRPAPRRRADHRLFG